MLRSIKYGFGTDFSENRALKRTFDAASVLAELPTLCNFAHHDARFAVMIIYNFLKS